MKIAIVGGGAIGLLFAYFLSEQHEVSLYVRTSEQKNELEQQGITYIRNGESEKRLISANIFENWRAEEDITIVTVKQYHLATIIEVVKKYDGQTELLFVQNGMGHLKYLQALSHSIIAVGIVEHGAVREGNTVVHHLGVGTTKLAAFSNKQSNFLPLLAEDSSPYFLMEWQFDYEEMMQKKLVVNAVVNTLTSVLAVKNGELVQNKYYQLVMQTLFEEIADTLSLDEFNRPIYNQHVVNVIKTTAENKSSMLKDLENERETEVDAILGYLIEIAEKNGNAVPFIRTYYDMIKGKEQSRKRR